MTRTAIIIGQGGDKARRMRAPGQSLGRVLVGMEYRWNTFGIHAEYRPLKGK